MRLEVGLPLGEFGFGHGEGDVSRACGAVLGELLAGLAAFAGVEQQQHPLAAAEECVPARLAAEQGEAEHVGIKTLRGGEVVHVEAGFEDVAELHRVPFRVTKRVTGCASNDEGRNPGLGK